MIQLKLDLRAAQTHFPQNTLEQIIKFERSYFNKHIDEYKLALCTGTIPVYDTRKSKVWQRYARIYSQDKQ